MTLQIGIRTMVVIPWSRDPVEKVGGGAEWWA